MVAGIGRHSHCLSQLVKRPAGHGIRIQGCRNAVVTPLTYALHNGNLTQKRYIELGSQTLAALFAKQLIAVIG